MPPGRVEQGSQDAFIAYRNVVKSSQGYEVYFGAAELITRFLQDGVAVGMFNRDILQRWKLSECLGEPSYEYRGYQLMVVDRMLILPDGREKKLTRMETRIFHPLIARAPSTVGHSFFSKYMFPERENWSDQDLGFDTQYLRMWIFRVRGKIEDYMQGGNYALIQTVQRAGYRFQPPELNEGGSRLLHLAPAA